MMRKKIPDYLLRMIDDYVSAKQIDDIQEQQMVSQRRDDMWFPSEVEAGQLVWNVMYDEIYCAWTYLLERASSAQRGVALKIVSHTVLCLRLLC